MSFGRRNRILRWLLLGVHHSAGVWPDPGVLDQAIAAFMAVLDADTVADPLARRDTLVELLVSLRAAALQPAGGPISWINLIGLFDKH